VISFPSNLVDGGGEKALPQTVENFQRMHDAAKNAGINLLITDGYRSPEEQWQLRQQYGCTNPASSQCPGGKQVAVSCHEGGTGSNHQTGDAVDINVGCGNGNSSCNTKAYNWLKTNGGQFGFYNALPSDPVHWSATGR
jgi:LAS superfamily LD-carboxypeptidase LdcB